MRADLPLSQAGPLRPCATLGWLSLRLSDYGGGRRGLAGDTAAHVSGRIKTVRTTGTSNQEVVWKVPREDASQV